MKYKNFELDKFQVDAIESIENNHSVVVSAATGTGKTLIADYIVDKAIKAGKRVIYTSPIKALSNQKYKEFHEQYGEKVGLLTGDISINHEAPILVMTTEIYRNMLLEKEPMDDLSYVVFDEIHFINDIERGTVWEESIIFSPKNVRFLCLSATIPNYQDFANWISTIKEHNVDTVNYMKRAVPLKHELFDARLGICQLNDLRNDKIPTYYDKRKRKKRKQSIEAPNAMELAKMLKQSDEVPAIYFTFSRRDAFEKAKEAGKKLDFTTSDEKRIIIENLRKRIPKNIVNMQSVKSMRSFMLKGFAVHHAGIFPKMKEIVEELFGMGVIKIIFATETFAVGINMPARAVILNSIKKYDGRSIRFLSTKEYFQMAGRAGRRGIDDHGRVIVALNRKDLDFKEIERITSKDVEPIISRFAISYNTVLNLVRNHTKKEREVILKSNFGYFCRKGNQSRIDQSYFNYLHTLKKMEYVSEKTELQPNNTVKKVDVKLTWKGAFATHIFSHELTLPEMYYSGIMHDLTDEELLLVITALEYEGRAKDKFYDKQNNVGKLVDKLSNNKYVFRKVKKMSLKKLYKFVYSWADGASFISLFKLCNLAEGDIIRLFRRVIDNLKQVKSACIAEKDEEIAHRLTRCIKKIDRDLVKVVL